MSRLRPGDELDLFCPGECLRTTRHLYEGGRLYVCLWCRARTRRRRLAS